MRRVQLFEIEDLPGCPRPIRDGMTDYLQFVIDRARPYAAAGPLLRAALERSGARSILGLCSGAGGPWPGLLDALEGSEVERVCLSDRYPNLPAFERVAAASSGRVGYEKEPVDAAAVPERLTGFRTLFSSF